MNTSLLRQHLPFLGVLLLALVVGVITAPAYGQTWDDQGLWDYADFSQQNYGDLFAGRLPADRAPTNHRYYGPAFLLFAGGLQNAAHAVGWQVPKLDVWHFAIFLSFLAGLAAFYALCMRISNPRSALWASLVFALQPLVWGHAFINAKDIPFMAAFLLAVVAGLRAADLPAYFLPQLLMQLTLPAMLLIGLGIVLVIRGRYATGETNSLHLMLAVWLLVPLIYTLLADSTMYDNFRQYLFILPPLFVHAVFAINWLAERLRPVWHQLAMAAILLAAAWQITTLFPYEYTFYNAFAGGTAGAAGRFELDYWQQPEPPRPRKST
jgi:hypothetical protein